MIHGEEKYANFSHIQFINDVSGVLHLSSGYNSGYNPTDTILSRTNVWSRTAEFLIDLILSLVCAETKTLT